MLRCKDIIAFLDHSEDFTSILDHFVDIRSFFISEVFLDDTTLPVGFMPFLRFRSLLRCEDIVAFLYHFENFTSILGHFVDIRLYFHFQVILDNSIVSVGIKPFLRV